MKVLVAGLGSIGQRHVRNLRALLGTEVEISAYRERGLSHVLNDRLEVVEGADVESRYGIRTFKRLDEALAESPQVTFVCNPTSRHAGVAIAAAHAGSDLFIEKPLSNSWEGVEELLALVDQKRLVSMIGFQFRFHPLIAFLERCVLERRIGTVLSGKVTVGEYLPAWHPYEDYRESYAARRELGGGAILTMSHELDWLNYIFGQPSRLRATGGRLSRLDLDVEDTVDIQLEYRGCSTVTHIDVHLDYLQSPPTRRAEFECEEGRMEIDLLAGTACVLDRSGQTTASVALGTYQRNDTFVDELSHFIDCVRARRETRIPLRDGARSLRVALAARQSLESGYAVEILT